MPNSVEANCVYAEIYSMLETVTISSRNVFNTLQFSHVKHDFGWAIAWNKPITNSNVAVLTVLSSPFYPKLAMFKRRL